MGFLAIFLGLVCWIDLILHIVIILNQFYHLVTLPGREGSFKNQKNAFLDDSNSQKELCRNFLNYGSLDQLDIANCDTTKCAPTLGNVSKS